MSLSFQPIKIEKIFALLTSPLREKTTEEIIENDLSLVKGSQFKLTCGIDCIEPTNSCRLEAEALKKKQRKRRPNRCMAMYVCVCVCVCVCEGQP